MDEKTRLRELIDIFYSIIPDSHKRFDENKTIVELNGYEGLLVWAPNGRFYQLSYKNQDTWNVTMFPYDIYDKRFFNKVERKWEDKV